MNPDDEMASMTEEARQEVEQKEDEFVNETEEAVGVMKNVCTIFELNYSYAHSMVFRSLIPPSRYGT